MDEPTSQSAGHDGGHPQTPGHDEAPPPTPGRRFSAGLVAQIAVVALALVPRLYPWPDLFVAGVLLPFSNDASYHVRRILRLCESFHYPGLFDPLLDWPRGAVTHWSPGFDCVAAALALVLGGGHDPHRAAQVAAILPAVYGLIGLVIVGNLATRVVPRADASREFLWVTAALFVALVPQSIAIARVGFVDHHVTELLFTALLWRWTVTGTELAEARAELGRRVRFEVVGAILVTAAVWVQSVGLLYVGVATAVLVTLQLTRAPSEPVARPWIGTGGPALGVGAVLLALLYAPAVREHGHAQAYEFPSYFQPTLLAFGCIAVVLAGRVTGRRDARPAGVALRLGAALLGVGAAAIVVFVLKPGARIAFDGLLQLAASKGPDLSRIDELQPLLGASGVPDGSRWDRLEGYFGWTGPACAVLLPLGLYAVRRAGRERFAAILVWTVALLGLSLAQNRWSRVLVVPIAVVCAPALEILALRLLAPVALRREAPSPPSLQVGMLASAFALVLLLAPDPILALIREPDREGAVMEAGMFLRSVRMGAERSEAPSAAPKPPVVPGQRSGILAPWNDAFQLLYLSGLPSLSTGHAWLVGEDGYRLERAAWRGRATDLWSLMDDRDLGYVVAGADNLASVKLADGTSVALRAGSTGQQINWDYFKKVPLGVMVLGGSALPELNVRNLDQLCPRFAGSEFAPLEVPLPRLWVFERVLGAILRGRGEPGTRVVAELRLQHAAGIVSYFAFTDVSQEGGFWLRFPVPTHMRASTLRSAATLRITRKGFAPIEIEVPEAAVLAGTVIEVPGAALAAPAPPR